MIASACVRRERVLVVDDAPDNLNLLTAILERQSLEVVCAPSAAVALSVAKRIDLDLAILDIVMPDMDGLMLSRRLADERSRGFPIIFVSGREDSPTIVKAFSCGGVDYVTKPIREDEVIARVNCHLRLARLQRELEARHAALAEANRRLEEQIAKRVTAEASLRIADEQLSLLHESEAERWGLPGFIGTSSATRAICDEIRRLFAFSRTNVLVTGESGSGKELIARAIHYGSDRRSKPFVAINCSAIPSELAESTFFGHARGAFTGATGDRRGCFEQSDGGTLFLDEIADLPVTIQAKLLRTLEDGTFTPVGAARERKAEVRVIGATHADVVAKVKAGSFRQDLYFRLAQYEVHVPPLRERRQDIPLLVRHFLKVFSSEMRRACPEVAPEALVALQRYSFPGNVRELKNVTERAVILSSGAKTIQRQHFQLFPVEETSGAPVGPLDTLDVEEMQTRLIQRALEQAGGNVSAAAKLLGVHRSWLYRRM